MLPLFGANSGSVTEGNTNMGNLISVPSWANIWCCCSIHGTKLTVCAGASTLLDSRVGCSQLYGTNGRPGASAGPERGRISVPPAKRTCSSHWLGTDRDGADASVLDDDSIYRRAQRDGAAAGL